MIQEVRVAAKDQDVLGKSLLNEIERTLKIKSIQSIRTVKVFRFEGLDENTIKIISKQTILDPLNEYFVVNDNFLNATKSIEIGLKPGVMNPEIGTLSQIIKNLGIDNLKAASSSLEYHFFGSLTNDELQAILDRLLINKTISQIIEQKPKTLFISATTPHTNIVPIRSMSIEELCDYAKINQLFLDKTELQTIKKYFLDQCRDASDAELETIAQTWSEHCSHKTFKSFLIIDGNEKRPLFKRLKEVASKFSKNVVSAFSDNAGTFDFYDGYAIAAKVETHNSPSAIEPYGGAATGSGGVFRDIMGTGKGAKIIASTDMFCFAPPDLENSAIPAGCLHPDYLLRRVVAGVRDYGNRMGIPTNNGSVHFHPDFRAKPTVIVGAYGLIPIDKCVKETPQLNDMIFVVGGLTGRDGIHGATFSSGAMSSQTSIINSTAVQIGNPIEQKRMADALLAARDANLIKTITDCGAGGFSSAIGEIGAEVGVSVELSTVPLKYSGMAPWEIWISESQERMICVVEQKNSVQFKEICEQYNVPTTNIGYFTNSKKLVVNYDGKIVCDLHMDFLHNGKPDRTLSGKQPQNIIKELSTVPNIPSSEQEWINVYKKIISNWNVCSKEAIVRQYDHTVQGMNILPPLIGDSKCSPQDATVLAPIYGKPYGLIISHGMNPILNRINPYMGSLWAIVEALANLVSVGGDISDVALVDNFIWPYPNQELLWALDRSMQACIDAMEKFEIPFISGKDSLSSTYTYSDGRLLEIPPVLCISAIGKIPNIEKTISSDFKKTDSLILLIGELDILAMGGSIYMETYKSENTQFSKVPSMNLAKTKLVFEHIHKLIKNEIILSCHDISEGGIAVALAEMCFAGNIGAEIDLAKISNSRRDFLLFNETAGCFIVEVSAEKYNEKLFEHIPHKCIGKTKIENSIKIMTENSLLFDIKLEELYNAWQNPIKEIFNS